MSEELRDLRTKIPTFVDVFLEAESRATGRDKSELVREVLKAWAEERHHVFIQTQRLLLAEGITGTPEGIAGNRGAGRG